RQAMARANKVRNRLIAEGVPAERIDAVGINHLNDEAVRVAVSDEETKVIKSDAAAGAGEPMGQAHFVSSEAMTIASDHSAMVSCQARLVRSTKLTFINRGIEDAVVYVRHQVAPGYELAGDSKDLEKIGSAYLFQVKVAAGGSTNLVIDEKTPMQKSLDLNGD